MIDRFIELKLKCIMVIERKKSKRWKEIKKDRKLEKNMIYIERYSGEKGLKKLRASFGPEIDLLWCLGERTISVVVLITEQM